MPSIYLITMEIIGLVLFTLCLWHAWHSGPEDVVRLIVGVLFGLLLEMATIRQLKAYSYGTYFPTQPTYRKPCGLFLTVCWL